MDEESWAIALDPLRSKRFWLGYEAYRLLMPIETVTDEDMRLGWTTAEADSETRILLTTNPPPERTNIPCFSK